MSHRFDEFSKSLADESLPRRESLRWLGAAIAGVVLSPLGLKPAWAAGRDRCKAFCKCRKRNQQNACLAACRACNNEPRHLCGSCAGGYTCCGDGQACCGDFCADLENDFYNCGECGFACEEPGTYEEGACLAGECEYQCVEGAVRCDGQCTPLNWDPNNCGACGNVCEEPTPYCNYGTCNECPSGLALCGESCVDLASDDQNCGACGIICEEGMPCSQGVCNPCPGGGTLCSGVCTNIAFDTLNCGGCGIVCADFETCSGGICQPNF